MIPNMVIYERMGLVRVKTLYVSDLDGTLLNQQSQISDFSASVINRFIDQGLLFSIATARSIGTVFDIIKKIHINIPISLMNGVFLCHANDPQPAAVFPFPADEAAVLLSESRKVGASPFFYQYDTIRKKLILQYLDLAFPPRKLFYQLRKDSFYKLFVQADTPRLFNDCIPLYINFLDEYDVLLKVHGIVAQLNNLQSVFYFDPVLKAWYLEVFSAQAGKAAGVKKLAQLVHADRIVVFGDNNNDLSMFSIADQSCAVVNAPDEIKQKADVLIDSCDNDGVARFLLQQLS